MSLNNETIKTLGESARIAKQATANFARHLAKIQDTFKPFYEQQEKITHEINRIAEIFQRIRKKYPEHLEAYAAFEAASKEDKDTFYDFVRKLYPGIKDPEALDDRVSYVWQILDRIDCYYPYWIQYARIKHLYRYIRTSVKRERKKVDSRQKQDPLVKKLETKMLKDHKGVEPLFVEMFAIDDDIDYVLTGDDWKDDLETIRNIISIEQTCRKLKYMPEGRLSEIELLLIKRYVFNVTRNTAGMILGWPDKQVKRVWRYYDRHKDTFQKIFNS